MSRIKTFKFAAFSVFCLIGINAIQAHAACDQISPNPNPVGGTITITGVNGCNDLASFVNNGKIQSSGNPLLTNNGTLTNNSIITSNFTGRFLDNNGTLNNNVGASLLHSLKLNNAGATVNNYGTISSISAFDFGLTNYGILNNYAGGGVFGNDPALNNASGGVVNNMGSIGQSQNGGLINNSGQLVLYGNSGVINNYSGGFIESTYLPLINGGTINNYAGSSVGPNALGLSMRNSGLFSIFSGASLTLGTFDYIQSAGTTRVDGTVDGNSNADIIVNGGVLQGTGSINTRVKIDGGTLAPGNSIGALTIDSNLVFTSGTLETEIAGIGTGDFDVLNITGMASFTAGMFSFSFLDGFLPTYGSSWLFLKAVGGISGWQNLGISVTGLSSDYAWFISEDNNGLTFNTVAAVPEPEVYAMMGLGLGLLGWFSRRRKLQVA